jgi:hypothetical protein
MTFGNFALAYLLTGCLFVIRLMGTHNSESEEVKLFGNKWTIANFKDQFSLHPFVIVLTIVAVFTWVLGFIKIVIDDYRSDKRY